MSLRELTAMLPMWFLRVAVLWFGLIWGSFLNVVIYRVPRDMSVVRPASHCPGCGKPVRGYDNIPVLSFLILRGRARCCGAKMSVRYPLVELIGGTVSLAIFETIVLKLAPETTVGRAAAVYAADFALCLGLVAAAFIDAEHMILPDSITLGGTALGIATASFRDLGWLEALEGAAIGFFIIWFPFTFLYKGLLGRTGMALGDAKLVALAGAWFGWRGAVFTLFAGAVHGVIYAVVTKLLGIESKLPEEVVKSLDELKKLAAEGDLEAQQELASDPLLEDEDDAFIIRWIQQSYRRLRGLPEPPPEPAVAAVAASAAAATAAAGATGPADANPADATPAADANPADATPAADANGAARTAAGREDTNADDADEPQRARIPFGPFLIFACLELLLAGPWIRAHLPLLFGGWELLD